MDEFEVDKDSNFLAKLFPSCIADVDDRETVLASLRINENSNEECRENDTDSDQLNEEDDDVEQPKWHLQVKTFFIYSDD